MTFDKFVENLLAGVVGAIAIVIVFGIIAIAIKAFSVLLIILGALVAIYFIGVFVNKKGWLF